MCQVLHWSPGAAVTNDHKQGGFHALSSIASGGCWKFLATPILGHRSHSRLHCPMACFSVYTPLFIRTPVEGGDPNPG